jgi:hypothetical protein
MFCVGNAIALDSCMGSPPCLRVSSNLLKCAYTSSGVNVACTPCMASKTVTYPYYLGFLSITRKSFPINFSLERVSPNSLNSFCICISLLCIFSMISPFSNLKFSNFISSPVILVFLIYELPSYLVIKAFHIS